MLNSRKVKTYTQNIISEYAEHAVGGTQISAWRLWLSLCPYFFFRLSMSSRLIAADTLHLHLSLFRFSVSSCLPWGIIALLLCCLSIFCQSPLVLFQFWLVTTLNFVVCVFRSTVSNDLPLELQKWPLQICEQLQAGGGRWRVSASWLKTHVLCRQRASICSHLQYF